MPSGAIRVRTSHCCECDKQQRLLVSKTTVHRVGAPQEGIVDWSAEDYMPVPVLFPRFRPLTTGPHRVTLSVGLRSVVCGRSYRVTSSAQCAQQSANMPCERLIVMFPLVAFVFLNMDYIISGKHLAFFITLYFKLCVCSPFYWWLTLVLQNTYVFCLCIKYVTKI